MKIYECLEELREMKNRIKETGRKPNDAERELAGKLLDRIDYLEGKALIEEKQQPTRPALGTTPDFEYVQSHWRKVTDTELPPLFSGEDKSYRTMFYGDRSKKLDRGGFSGGKEFAEVLMSGKFDKRMSTRANMIEGVFSDGGASVPEEISAQWLDSAIEDEIIRPLATVWPMRSNVRKIPGFDGSDRSGGEYFGGFEMEFLAEEQTRTKQTAKLRMIELNAKKGAIFTDVSNELMSDGLGFETQLTMALRKSISRGMDNAFINGTGSGQPQGILNSPSLIQVAKESAQDADTILYANIAKQYARMYPAGRKRGVWLISDTCIPELLQLSIPVGTGGSHVPVLRETDGKFTMIGRPVYFSELMPVLGDANDCVFCDASQYGVGIRKEMSIDVSNVPGWTQDLTSLRIIVRFDGQGTWAKPITPKKGATQSWVVGLAARN